MSAPKTHVLIIQHALTKKMAISAKIVPHLFVKTAVGALIRQMDPGVIVQKSGLVRHVSKEIFVPIIHVVL